MTNEQSTDRAEPRAILALITLATGLPVPTCIRFHPNGKILSLDVHTAAEGQAWSTYLGGRTDTYVHDGRRYLDAGTITWHGWSVHLHASDDVTPDHGLDEHTRAELLALAETACTA